MERAKGFEPFSPVWKTEAQPLDQARILVAGVGVEPTSADYEPAVRPLNYPAVELAGPLGIEPSSFPVNSRTLSP